MENVEAVPHSIAASAASQVVRQFGSVGDGLVVQVRISRVKRNEDPMQPSLHEVMASVEIQRMEPT